MHHESTVEEFYMVIARLQFNTSSEKGQLFSIGSKMKPSAKTTAENGERQVFAAFTPNKADSGISTLKNFCASFTGKKDHEDHKGRKQVWDEKGETLMKPRVSKCVFSHSNNGKNKRHF